MSDLLKSAETLNAMFWPRACAVLGASDNPSKIGGIPVRFFKEYGYEGDFYPINPTRDTVQGLPAFPSIEDVDGPVDMAIMAVPEHLALETAEACARKGVKALVTLTSGFAEAGEQGIANQARLKQIGKDAGMRIVGPNCLGYFNPKNHIYATFSTSFTHGMPKVGNVGMVSQSGAFGSHCFVLGREKGIGFSYWVTTGNEVDVDVAECIAFMSQDPGTDVICAYIEGCKDGARLEEALRLAYEARKPLLIQKVGRSDVGTQAAASHTASLTGADQVYDAVFERYNAYRCLTVDELIDITHAASNGVLPKGRNVAVGSISGGAAVMMADAASDAGLEMEPLPDAAQAKLKELIPFAGTRNPVDFTAMVYNDLSLITKNFDVILGEGNYDAVVGFFAFLAYSEQLSESIIEALKPIREKYPDALILMSVTGPKHVLDKFEEAGFPCIAEPYRALEVVAALAKIEEGFQKGLPSIEGMPEAPTLKPGKYNEMEAKAILAEAGVPSAQEKLTNSADDAASAASEIGYPVVMKIVSPDILHKTEIGGVALGLADDRAVKSAYNEIMERAKAAYPNAKVDGIMVGRMVTNGTEMILGVQSDAVFGPVVMAGLGGIFTEVLKDVTFMRAPFGKREAMEMINRLKGSAILKGARGTQKADIEAVAEAIARVSVFADKNADVLDSIDVNPLLVLPEGEGAVALDGLIVTKE
jgi:acyl-CoA synthetase (NDP forming)